MPDLVTHVAAGYVVALPFWKRTSARVLFFLGTVLPDLATRPLNIFLPGAGRFTEPLHSPVGYTVLCWFAAQLFAERGLRKTAFWMLFAGGFLHFAMDALQKHVAGGYTWLFPFSTVSYSWGLFWPEDGLAWLPVWALAIVVIELVMRQRSRKSEPYGP